MQSPCFRTRMPNLVDGVVREHRASWWVLDFRQEPAAHQLAGGLRLFTGLFKQHPCITIAGHTEAPDGTWNRTKACPEALFDVDGFRLRVCEEVEGVSSKRARGEQP